MGVIFFKEPDKVVKWAVDEGLWDSLSPLEQHIFRVPISDLSPDEKKRKQQTMQSNMLIWRIEGLLTLLWGMGLVEKLELPVERFTNQQVKAYEKEEELPFDMMVTYERINALNWICGLIGEWDD